MVVARRRRDPVARPAGVQSRLRGVAAPAARRDEPHRPAPRPTAAMTVCPVQETPGALGRASRAWPWHQLPVHSPVALGAAWRSARLGLGAGEDSRPRVRALVRVLYQADDAVLVGSGTQALTLALRAAAATLGGGSRRSSPSRHTPVTMSRRPRWR